MKKITKEEFATLSTNPRKNNVVTRLMKLVVGEGLVFSQKEWGMKGHPTGYLNQRGNGFKFSSKKIKNNYAVLRTA